MKRSILSPRLLQLDYPTLAQLELCVKHLFDSELKGRLPGCRGAFRDLRPYYRVVGTVVLKVRPSPARSTTTVSPGPNSPLMIRLESGFSMWRRIARARGRAPNLGS
jgi:hypothetical protein